MRGAAWAVLWLWASAARLGAADAIPEAPIAITADAANQWNDAGREVWLLEGRCRLAQGDDSVESRSAVVWIERAADGRAASVVGYFEGGVRVELARDGRPTQLAEGACQAWLGTFATSAGIDLRVPRIAGPPAEASTLYQRARARRTRDLDSPVRPVQYTEPAAPGPLPGPVPEPVAAGPIPPAGVGEPLPAGNRRISVYARSDVPPKARLEHDVANNQWIAVIDQGVNLIVEGLSDVRVDRYELSTIDVSTDRLVIWTSGVEEPDLTGQRPQPESIPLELYMEGNIVFREGDRVIYAHRMYYDVNHRIGIVLDAELLTPVPNYEGLLRLKTDLLQQVGPNRFVARNTFITSSRMGQPGYRIQVGDAYLEDEQRPVFDPRTGIQAVDPHTGDPLFEHRRLATGRNNVLYLGRLPVFYAPYLATDLTDPSFYVKRARVRNDSVFGTQVLTDWDGYQLLGIRNPPEGTDWDMSLDYLSDRGLGHGSSFLYGRDDFLSIPGPASGLVDFWGIKDDGVDNLGRNRRSVAPEKEYRHRLFWRHRQMVVGDLQVTAEAGWISDRNFLEQYYENEWDELKDQTTGIEVKQSQDNLSWSVTADYRVNEFFTQTDWLPRFDHFWLGQPLLDDALTWYQHTSIGYARFGTATAPDDLAPSFHHLPWETAPGGAPLGVDGERLATRHEIDWPLQAGPVKVVPYALGEAAHWGADRQGKDVQRLYGQLGVRASLPVWKVDRSVRSELWNLNGLAHKVVFDVDLSYSDASQDLDDLPLYDPLDDDSIEAFRRKFDPVLLAKRQLDERFYAVRSGLGGWVTSPSTEIAEDLLALRLGARQRWQTKRGGAGRERIIDWIVFDTQAVVFPNDDRDNFGRTLGLVDYNLRWHLGDRLTLMSEGAFDFFDSGQQIVTIGGFLDRPPRGSLYAGLHLLDGPFSSDVLSLAYTYRMSDKWVSAFGMSIDLQGDGNIGQNFSITRIGESLLVTAGMTVDASRDNVGFNLAVEPRFLPKTRLGQAGGARIPVAGAHGLQ